MIKEKHRIFPEPKKLSSRKCSKDSVDIECRTQQRLIGPKSSMNFHGEDGIEAGGSIVLNPVS